MTMYEYVLDMEHDDLVNILCDILEREREGILDMEVDEDIAILYDTDAPTRVCVYTLEANCEWMWACLGTGICPGSIV